MLDCGMHMGFNDDVRVKLMKSERNIILGRLHVLFSSKLMM